jgi:DNA-binding transcriptional LysR family regulator
MSTNHFSHILMKDLHMNFSQLQCFVALAEMGSFTEAAYEVGLTQSAVSHALSALENELGVTLLERNRKGVVALTSTGQRVLLHARTLLASATAIEQEAKSASGVTAGKLRLASMEAIVGPRLLVRMLSRFEEQYPDIEVVLFEGTMPEVSDWIINSVVDLGFVIQPPEGETSGLASTPIARDELCILVGEQHPLSTKPAVTCRDLRDEGFIMAKTRCTLKFLELAGFEQNGSKPLVRYQASDSATILAMVREGLGISLVPRMTLPKRLDGVVALPLNPEKYLEIGLAVRSQATASPLAKLFTQTAQTITQEHLLLAKSVR